MKREAAKQPTLQVVPSVGLKRSAGKWFEIARLPNSFQRSCASNTTATYTLQPAGEMIGSMKWRKSDGHTTSSKGTAKVADAKGPNTK
jgi:apolipoprotein D and lipocalin family protein